MRSWEAHTTISDLVWEDVTINFSALLEIPFCWGSWTPADGLDCVGLANYVRELHGASSFDSRLIQWVYDLYPSENDAPPDLIAQIAQDLGEPREVASPLDLILLRSQRGVICLGTYLADGSVVFIDQRVRILPLERVLRTIELHSIVFPARLIRKM